MFLLRWLVYLYLILPGDPPPIHPPLSVFRQVCLEEEIIDPECESDLFKSEGMYYWHLQWVRGRYERLKDAPRSWDFRRLPTLENLKWLQRANWQYEAWLEERARAFPTLRDEIGEALQETRALHTQIAALKIAASPYYALHHRREKLAEYRELVGYERYYAGYCPPAIPPHLLWVVDP